MGRRSLKIVGIAVALLGRDVVAHAGAFETSSQDFDILFEQGNVVDSSVVYVAPQRRLTEIGGSTASDENGGINPATGRPFEKVIEEAKGYWMPKISAKFDLTSDLACAAQYRRPWGISTEVGIETVRSYPLAKQKITSNDYGVNCSYRFDAGAVGYFRILGGVSYQELRGQQTRMIPHFSRSQDGIPGSPFRAASLDADDQSFGWRIGAAYENPEYAMRASLVYQSEVKYGLEGTVDNLILNPITGRGVAINVDSDVSTPQSVEFKFQTGIAPGWLAFGSVEWMDWSSVTSVDFVASDNEVLPTGTRVTSLNLYYQDGWTLRGGIGHRFNDHWSLDGTLTWDRGTSTGLTTQTDLWLFTLGTGYKPSDKVDIRLAGAAGWLVSGRIDATVDDGKRSLLGSEGVLDDDFVSGLSLTAMVKF
ncbi:transporter [Ochrobactrum sp. Q0168]|uniref:OmpP1/FadL family transporter n=1 Tax=Ochrobactrum sp. Q0168 TaxID=2793241 RepID=UPI0018EAEF18|nr:transporter [Ochrobactrum sp. Q0168]